jgi:hypothetical protein
MQRTLLQAVCDTVKRAEDAASVRSVAVSTRSTREICTEFIAPASDRLVCHDPAALEEQFFDVAQAQLEPEVPTHGTTYDAHGETVAVKERF